MLEEDDIEVPEDGPCLLVGCASEQRTIRSARTQKAASNLVGIREKEGTGIKCKSDCLVHLDVNLSGLQPIDVSRRATRRINNVLASTLLSTSSLTIDAIERGFRTYAGGCLLRPMYRMPVKDHLSQTAIFWLPLNFGFRGEGDLE